ncbi:MAG: DNA polymerase Y family protein [Pseudomonadota bacterium]
MKRYLSLWFPDWPLTRLRRARLAAKTGSPHRPSEGSDRRLPPFVLIESDAHGLRIAAASPSARQLGIIAGLAFTDAKARAPHLVHEDIDRHADAEALRSLANWMIRFTPLVSIDGTDGLMLETTGCAHLHGGEAGLVKQVNAVLSREGFPHQAGLASTPVAAAALAHAAASGTVLDAGREREGLADLPVRALRLSEEAETLLRRFGLTRIGQLYGVDRKALARRFQSRAEADAVLLRLDRALGLRHDPITPLRPAPSKTARLACPDPLISADAIALGLEQLTQTLCADLEGFGQGARGFTLHAFRSDGSSASVEISAARPVRTSKHILRLFAEKLDRIDPGFGIDLLLLEARRTGPMDTSAAALSGDLAANDTDIAALAALSDRICAKLGEGSVTVTTPFESYLPERAERRDVFRGELPAPPVSKVVIGPRPIRLLQRPERVEALAEVPDGPPRRFIWRRITRKVVRADGPERISPEWWTYTAPLTAAPSPEGASRKWLTPKLDPRADAGLIRETRKALEVEDTGEGVTHRPRARDYYRLEDEAGRRYWLFREGLYGDGRGGPPSWYMHGFFA